MQSSKQNRRVREVYPCRACLHNAVNVLPLAVLYRTWAALQLKRRHALKAYFDKHLGWKIEKRAMTEPLCPREPGNNGCLQAEFAAAYSSHPSPRGLVAGYFCPMCTVVCVSPCKLMSSRHIHVGLDVPPTHTILL